MLPGALRRNILDFARVLSMERFPTTNVIATSDRFVEVGLESGLTDVQPAGGALWLDYDRDGHLESTASMSL
jgi:hypothetical protein